MSHSSSFWKAREFFRSAELCFENRLYNAAASHAYYAVFWAAIAALDHEGHGRPSWSHPSLRQTFQSELIHRRQIYPGEFFQILDRAYSLRDTAHYKSQRISAKDARRNLDRATTFLTTVEEAIKQ